MVLDNLFVEIASYFFFALVFGFIIFFLFIRGKKKKEDDLNTLSPAERRNVLAERMRRLEEDEDEEGVDDEASGLSKRQLNKLLKKRDKDSRRREREAERAEQESRLETKRQHQSEKQRLRDEARQAKELEEKKKADEEKKREQEEYAKWEQEFIVEQDGAEADDDSEEVQSRLSNFIQYITSNKVVELDDLAAEFSLSTSMVIDRIKSLEKDERLTGIMDDRGKYIYIAPAQFEELAKFVKKVGRISKTDLVRETNRLIKLQAEVEDKLKRQEDIAALTQQLESELEPKPEQF